MVNNYLMGNDPYPSTCCTGTPIPDATRHAQFLRAQHVPEELAARAGGITLAGVPIDLRQIKTPVCFLSAYETTSPRGPPPMPVPNWSAVR